jgi:NADH-quinone oxidoreductase subunit L
MPATIITLLTLATMLPLLSSVTVILFGKRSLPGQMTAFLATGVMGVSFLLSFLAMILWWFATDGAAVVWNVPWIPVPGLDAKWLYLGVLVDGLTIAMMVMVTLISTLVHTYSIGYMQGDKRFERFFAYLSLFTFSMLGIVIANSIMQLFVFWELVGLTSYLLIGFWFEKRGPQQACKKAFVMNRIGDAGFLIGFGILFSKLGANVLLPGGEGAMSGSPSMFGALADLLKVEGFSITHPPAWLTLAGLGLFCGAIGKSAQFPLHTWLPDAMEGPTPVSSIVHSATMVAAGVYLTARIYPILTPEAHLVIATIGLITLVMAACMALVMTDIKRVLAYSTLSQLGYMILGLGTGNYVFALYHLFTHAFFKCCLFQCAGSVIHAAHHQQDMRYYGGLKDKMPKTALCYAICTLAISGASIPLISSFGINIGISGFHSKDGILAGAWNYGSQYGWLFFWGPLLVAYLTAFYMARSFALTFLGKPRDQHLYDNAHEAPATMVVPQLILAAIAVISIPIFIWKPLLVQTHAGMTAAIEKYSGSGAAWVQSLADVEHGEHHIHMPLLFGLAWIVAIGAGLWFYKDGLARATKVATTPGVNYLHKWVHNKFYFDALYDVLAVSVGKAVAGIASIFDWLVVDGLVNLAGFITRALASLSGRTDKKYVDGAVDGAANFAFNAGAMLRTSQMGRVRAYVLILLASACLAMIAVMVVVMVTKA